MSFSLQISIKPTDRKISWFIRKILLIFRLNQQIKFIHFPSQGLKNS